MKMRAEGLACHAVGPIDLEVTGGRCLAIVGPSGSGKSLILRMLADLIPHEGSCWLDDIEAASVPAPRWRSWVRYVSSEPSWWAPTVGNHFGQPAGQIAAMQRLGLSPSLMDAAPERLSTGERQRMAFLRSIESQPKVLLLDEPTSALDTDTTRVTEQFIHEQKQAGCAIVIVSHDPEQVARLADDVFRLAEKP